MKLISIIALTLLMSCGSDSSKKTTNNTNNNLKSTQNIKNRSDVARRILNNAEENERFLYTCEEVSELKSNRSKQTLNKVYTYEFDKCGIFNVGFLCQNHLIVRERTITKANRIEVKSWQIEVDRNQQIFKDDFEIVLNSTQQRAGIIYRDRDSGLSYKQSFSEEASRINYQRYCEDRI